MFCSNIWAEDPTLSPCMFGKKRKKGLSFYNSISIPADARQRVLFSRTEKTYSKMKQWKKQTNKRAIKKHTIEQHTKIKPANKQKF